jgi:hypothetical protein
MKTVSVCRLNLLPLMGVSMLLASVAMADNRPSGKPPHPPLFAELDTNSDGKISRAEAASDPMLEEIFSKFDANSDGYLTEDEMPQPGKGTPPDGVMPPSKS